VVIRFLGIERQGRWCKNNLLSTGALLPEGVEFLKCGHFRGKDVTAIGKDREDGAKDQLSIAPRGEAFASCTELSNCSESGLGKCQPSLEVGGGLDCGAKPVGKAPYGLKL